MSICALLSIYSYKLTVSNGVGGHLALTIYMVSIYSYVCKLTVSNGEGGHLTLLSRCALVSIYSYKLTISNGVSLMT